MIAQHLKHAHSSTHASIYYNNSKAINYQRGEVSINAKCTQRNTHTCTHICELNLYVWIALYMVYIYIYIHYIGIHCVLSDKQYTYELQECLLSCESYIHPVHTQAGTGVMCECNMGIYA